MAETFPVILGQTLNEELHLADKSIEADRLALFSLARQVHARLPNNVRVLIDRPPVYTPEGFVEAEDPATLLSPQPTDIYIRPIALNELTITAAIGETLRYHPRFGREQRRDNAYRERRAMINIVGGASLVVAAGTTIAGDYNSLLTFVSGVTLIGSVMAHGLNLVYYQMLDVGSTNPPPHASPESTPPIKLINISNTGETS